MDPELIFTKQERIGKGSFGEVFKGIDNRTQQVKLFVFLQIKLFIPNVRKFHCLNLFTNFSMIRPEFAYLI